MDVVSFDLDSTVCHTMHRRHIINTADRTKTDWHAYSMACANDGEGPAMSLLVSMCRDNFIVVSRRETDTRDITFKWFADRGLQPMAMMLLKDEFSSQERDHALWKVIAIKDYEARTGNRVVLHVDDRLDVTEAMEAAGIPALTVRGVDPAEGE